MQPLRHFVRVLVLASLAGILPAESALSAPKDTEAELLSRIARETDQVRKAKLQIRLARIKLAEAIAASERSGIEGSHKMLHAYLEQVKNAWATLQRTGRPAHKKPQGFKELDIALREDSRFIDNLRRRVSFLDREPVEKIAAEVEQLRAEVLKALFPPVEAKK